MTGQAQIPRSPYSPEAAGRVFDPEAKLREWGIKPDPLSQEPETVQGPLVDVGEGYHRGERACAGSFHLTDQEGPMWEATCDGCGAVVTVSARKIDPSVQRQARLEAANLPAIFAARPFARHPDVEPVLDQLRTWIAGCAGQAKPVDRRSCLLPAPAFYGQPGRGKTHLLVKVCQRVIEECGLSALFTTTRDLLRGLQRFEDQVEITRLWERATTVDVLALDDLGAEQSTEWRLEQLAHLVDERYRNELPIVLATNFAPDSWADVLDARTVSRLNQMTFALELKGVDRRLSSQTSEEAA